MGEDARTVKSILGDWGVFPANPHSPNVLPAALCECVFHLEDKIRNLKNQLIAIRAGEAPQKDKI